MEEKQRWKLFHVLFLTHSLHIKSQTSDLSLKWLSITLYIILLKIGLNFNTLEVNLNLFWGISENVLSGKSEGQKWRYPEQVVSHIKYKSVCFPQYKLPKPCPYPDPKHIILNASSYCHSKVTQSAVPLSYRTEIQEVAEFLVSFHCSHPLLLFAHNLRSLINPKREICRHRILTALADKKVQAVKQ